MDLLNSCKFLGLESKNRVVMAPMCVYKAKTNGKATLFHKIHYGTRAMGGVGVIIVEASAVEKIGRISSNDLGLWDDEQIETHAQITKTCHKFGSLIGVQLAHAGRKSKSDEVCVSPSATIFGDDYKKAKELSVDEVKELINKFIDAGVRAIDAGYDFVEIHAAHGYLIHEFLSPLTNLRKDEFGGDFFSRAKFLFEIAKGLKNKKIPFGVRLSADEYEDGGFDLQETKTLATWLESYGAGYLHISSGGNSPSPKHMPKLVPFYQCEFAKEIKNLVKIPVIAVGLIDSIKQAQALRLGGVCDFVAFGRELLRNPNLVYYGLRDFKKQDEILDSYQRAFE